MIVQLDHATAGEFHVRGSGAGTGWAADRAASSAAGSPVRRRAAKARG